MISQPPPPPPPTSFAVRKKQSAPFLLLIIGSCILLQGELNNVSPLKGRRGRRTLLRSERLDLAEVQMSEGFEEELPTATISTNIRSSTMTISTTEDSNGGKDNAANVLQNKDRFQSTLIRSLAIENRQDGFFPQLGLMNEMDESVRRFDLYFDFDKSDKTNRCVDEILHPDRSSSTGGGTNSHPHPKILEGTPEWEAIAQRVTTLTHNSTSSLLGYLKSRQFYFKINVG